MAREIEAKFRLVDADALRQRLGACGAERVNAVREHNSILDTPDRQLLGRGCGLRIRAAEPLEAPGPRRVTLTYKGPREPGLQGQGIKARQEIETAVADDVCLAALFARLGFAPVLCYEKRRETWRLGSAEITLDELPQLGWFVEIEAPYVSILETVRDQLALDPAAAVPETYPELTARHGAPDADGARSLRFGAQAPPVQR